MLLIGGHKKKRNKQKKRKVRGMKGKRQEVGGVKQVRKRKLQQIFQFPRSKEGGQ